jgi:drug/metabolite transporter (DMT)-like permease
MLLASLSYALGATYAKHYFSGIPPTGMAIGQLTAATVFLLPLSAVSVPERAPSSVVVLCMLGLAVLSTALAYLIYFRLIENVGPTSTVTVTLLVPVFGLLFGVLLLDEPFGSGTIAGLALILCSVVLITGVRPSAIGRRQPARKADR